MTHHTTPFTRFPLLAICGLGVVLSTSVGQAADFTRNNGYNNQSYNNQNYAIAAQAMAAVSGIAGKVRLSAYMRDWASAKPAPIVFPVRQVACKVAITGKMTVLSMALKVIIPPATI